MKALFTHTYDGCLLPCLTAIMVFGAESALSCQQEGPIFFFFWYNSTLTKKSNCSMMFGLKTQAPFSTSVEHYDRGSYKTVS